MHPKGRAELLNVDVNGQVDRLIYHGLLVFAERERHYGAVVLTVAYIAHQQQDPALVTPSIVGFATEKTEFQQVNRFLERADDHRFGLRAVNRRKQMHIKASELGAYLHDDIHNLKWVRCAVEHLNDELVLETVGRRNHTQVDALLHEIHTRLLHVRHDRNDQLRVFVQFHVQQVTDVPWLGPNEHNLGNCPLRIRRQLQQVLLLHARVVPIKCELEVIQVA